MSTYEATFACGSFHCNTSEFDGYKHSSMFTCFHYYEYLCSARQFLLVISCYYHRDFASMPIYSC